MAVTGIIYSKFTINLQGGETAGETKKIDWLSDTIKAALFTSAYTPAQDTDELYSALTGELSNGTGYTTGGNTCASPTYTPNTTTNGGTFDASDPGVWTATGARVFRYVVIYDSTTDVLIQYYDNGSDITLANTQTFTFSFDAANGLYTTSTA
jgi:hypothetical protein